MKGKIFFGVSLFIIAFTLGACASQETDGNHQDMNMQEVTAHSDHSKMDHSSSGEIPEGLKKAENPTFPVGSKAMIHSDHMEGMEGAEATIVGAFDTTVYTVTYTPTTGREEVKNHKWVVHEEIENAGAELLQPGTEVLLDADHMEGMDGATAIIDSAEETTVYMVDFTDTTGENVTNHKWVTENELKAE